MDLRLSAFVLFALVAVSHGLECHQCSSKDDAACADPFEGDFKKPCAEGEFCRKIYQNIRGDVSVIRSCGSELTEKYGQNDCYTTVLEEYNTISCACDAEGCNGSSALSGLSVASVTLLAAVAAYLNIQ